MKVLREVGLVDVREEGRQRLYRLNGRPLKPIHDWVKNYQQAWEERFGASSRRRSAAAATHDLQEPSQLDTLCFSD